MTIEQIIKDFKSQCISGYFEEQGVQYVRVVNGYDGWLHEKMNAMLDEIKGELIFNSAVNQATLDFIKALLESKKG